MTTELRRYAMTIMRPGQVANVVEVELPVRTMTDHQLMQAGYAPGATVAAGAPGPGFDILRRLLETYLGGNLEHVSVLWNGKPADMFVHETGRLDGMPRNEAATAIYRAYWLSEHPEANPEDLHWIAGPAVLFDKRVWF